MLAQLFHDLQTDRHERGVEHITRMGCAQAPFARLGAGRAGDQDDAIGQEQGFVDVVGDQHRSRAVVGGDTLQQGLHIAARDFVQGAEGLIKQQDFGLTHQGSGQRGALCHTARQLRWVPAFGPAQADFPNGRPDPLCLLRASNGGLVLEVQAEVHVFFERKPGQQARILEDKPGSWMRPGQWLALQAHAAAVRPLQTSKHAQ